MRILQLIDSLDAGGAERMAVQIANELAVAGHHSFLCATRKEGLLKSTINEHVGYLFIAKKGKLGLLALKRLYNYVCINQIEIIHAHSTSFFSAILIKCLKPSLKIVWHDHYGNAEDLEHRPVTFLKFTSVLFDGVISVNHLLRNWSLQHLKVKKVAYIHNFVSETVSKELSQDLPGKKGKRIVHLANLRPQKDHWTLLESYMEIAVHYPDWTLLLVGKNFNDDYAKDLAQWVKSNELDDKIHFLGARSDVAAILNNATIGVLSSKSEGLPVALLEYGLAGLPVVVTDVGSCKEVVNNLGSVIAPRDVAALKEAIQFYIKNKAIALETGTAFKNHVSTTFGAHQYIKHLSFFYSSLHD